MFSISTFVKVLNFDKGFLLNLVISTEKRNHTSNSTCKMANLCRVSSVISLFSRNDKTCGYKTKKPKQNTSVFYWNLEFLYWNLKI